MGFKTFNIRERIKSFAKDKTGYIKPTFFFFLNWVLTFIIFLLVIIFFFRFIIVLVKGVFDLIKGKTQIHLK
jgi:hypothetical protein